MDLIIIEDYVEKVYGFSINHTYSYEEADELSQEILFTAVKELPKLRNENKFEPWLWGIANNVLKVFRRNMGKRRAEYSYDVLDDIKYDDEFLNDIENEELYDFLRIKIAMLSEIYRDTIIFYYYDGLSIKEISEKMQTSEGTISWRLSEARKKLKKEYESINETILRPVKMNIDIYGSGNYGFCNIPFPSVYINDLISQNILYYCYEEAKSVQELANLCGIPAYYVEERLENLVNRNAVIKLQKGKYKTDFIIWTDDYSIYCENNIEKELLPIADKLIQALKKLAKEVDKISFYKAEKTQTELFYLYGVMAFDYLSRHFCDLKYPEIKPNYDGYKWRYIASMESGTYHRAGIGIQGSRNLESRGTFSHYTYKFADFIFRKMMPDDYINVCEDILLKKKTDDEYSAAKAICEGYIIRNENGELLLTIPAFTKDQKTKLDSLVIKYMSELMPEYSEIVNNFADKYKKLFPKHLSEDADRMIQGLFFGFYEYIVLYGQKKGLIESPAPGSICDVLIQYK